MEMLRRWGWFHAWRLVFMVYSHMGCVSYNYVIDWRLLHVSQIFETAAERRRKIWTWLGRVLYSTDSAFMVRGTKGVVRRIGCTGSRAFPRCCQTKIAAKIGQLALEEKAPSITQDLVIRGYIIATPKRDHKFLIKRLKEKNIDYSKYEALFLNKNISLSGICPERLIYME